MKKVTLSAPQSEIDWSVPQWVQHKEVPTMIILTTGRHDAYMFQGTCLPCNVAKDGVYSDDWSKARYRRLEGSIPFTISND